MDKDELIKFLKENLGLKIDKRVGFYGSQGIKISLILKDDDEEVVIDSVEFSCHA